MKSHTGERNYECSICFKKFLYSYNVVAHVRNVHEKNSRRGIGGSYNCKNCNASFLKQQKYNEHMFHVHQIVISKGEVIEEEEIFEYEDEKID